MDRMMAPVPPAFGPPPQGGMGGQMGMVKPAGPTELLASLKELVGTPIKQPEPVYRPGYVKPPKPDPQEIHAVSKRLFEAARMWRVMIYITQQWVDQKLTGAFKEDVIARQLGFQEEYISSALSDERNLVISQGASRKPSFMVIAPKDELRGYAQRLEDTAVWLRKEAVFTHAMRGERPLEIDEWSIFTDYGMYVARDTLKPYDARCPIESRLIDPAQVHPVYDAHGLKAVYRVNKDTVANIVAAYGDFSKTVIDKLRNSSGTVNDETEVEVIEYWDTWWRSVQIGDDPIIPVTAHAYGDCPYTVQYGGMGFPMFTRAPQSGAFQKVDGQWTLTGNSIASERVSKAVPYLYYRLRTHDQFEAIMARIITGFKREIHPSHIRYRSIEVADKDLPALDLSPGATNDAALGEEKLEPIQNQGTQQASMLIAALQQDKQTGSAPPGMYGIVDKSNVTGVAQSGANDAGQHLLFPTMKAWEYALTQRMDKSIRLLGNMGHLPKYADKEVRPIIVPAAKRRKGQDTGYEFDREIITKVGSRVEVSFTKVDPRDWPALFAAAKNGVDGGFVLRREIRALATGDHDFDTFYEEWGEENALFAAQQLPEFQKLNVAAEIMMQIKENDGRPDIQAGYRKMFELWMQAMQPAPQPQAPGQMGAAPAPGNMGAPAGAQPPPGAFPPSPSGVTPGIPGGMSYPQLGAGPGSQGGQVGRPY